MITTMKAGRAGRYETLEEARPYRAAQDIISKVQDTARRIQCQDEQPADLNIRQDWYVMLDRFHSDSGLPLSGFLQYQGSGWGTEPVKLDALEHREDGSTAVVKLTREGEATTYETSEGRVTVDGLGNIVYDDFQ